MSTIIYKSSSTTWERSSNAEDLEEEAEEGSVVEEEIEVEASGVAVVVIEEAGEVLVVAACVVEPKYSLCLIDFPESSWQRELKMHF